MNCPLFSELQAVHQWWDNNLYLVLVIKIIYVNGLAYQRFPWQPLSQESFQPQQKLQQYNSVSFRPFLGLTNWEIGAAGNQCTVWRGFSPAAMAPRLKVHRKKRAGICISRREIKSRMNLLERRHFKIWEHSWIPKVNYTIRQMFQELLFHFFFFCLKEKF